jgi:hypothetical protein
LIERTKVTFVNRVLNRSIKPPDLDPELGGNEVFLNHLEDRVRLVGCGIEF